MDFVLSLNQISKLVFANGMDKTYVIEGPMGSGKTSIINLAKEKFGDKYNYVVVDCTQWDVGDFQLPDSDKVAEVMRFLPNVLLVGDGTKPMFIVMDEIGKASRPVQNAGAPSGCQTPASGQYRLCDDEPGCRGCGRCDAGTWSQSCELP